MTQKAAITLTYCSQCNWMLRACWMAQELLHITVGDELIWDRKRDDGFPDAAELKRRVRDICFPEKPLGHVDKSAG